MDVVLNGINVINNLQTKMKSKQIQKRLNGMNKVMFYNIYYRYGFPPKVEHLLVLEEQELERFAEAFLNGHYTFFFNGRDYDISKNNETRVYDVSKLEYKNKEECEEKINHELNLDRIARVPFDISLFGKKVTNKYIKGKWGCKHPRGTFLGLTQTNTYIDISRIHELETIRNEKFDLKKLIRLCEELNSAYSQHNFYATGMLVRAIIDHVPPIFGFGNFEGVVNHYTSEKCEKSFKKLMGNLNSFRNISDSFLHSQVRKSETLPNETQIDCKKELDVLLAEVVRVLN